MSSRTSSKKAAAEAAEAAIQSIGLGYDLTVDLKLKYCKRQQSAVGVGVDCRLIAIDDDQVREIAIPGAGGLCIPNVPKSIKCDKGERMRFGSDVLSFQQMSEQFNQELTLSGCLGVTISNKLSPLILGSCSTRKFIDKYGTHVIVGVKMGGKDMIYAKQQHSSPLQPAEVQKKLKDMADKMYIDGAGQSSVNSEKFYERDKLVKERGRAIMDTIPSSSYSCVEVQDIKFMCKRKGGSLYKNLPYNEWCHTVQIEPDVISMSLVPITSLLSGIHGSGFLSHAINLYLRYKPPIEELHQFLEFQLPRQWAPVFGELALGPQRKQQSSASLQFSFMGPKLYVNTTPVDVASFFAAKDLPTPG
ncbi:hypothetical protein L3X38_026154 [Prunus dulcis]|uniref:MACPF domain-containing protein n=1 Tax=Prunus dulcis TaxID=3755 RepID=A0AAD4W328_PRUDU|nr:hypothetical protein L3X38_026154 [Prunus dulcis]